MLTCALFIAHKLFYLVANRWNVERCCFHGTPSNSQFCSLRLSRIKDSFVVLSAGLNSPRVAKNLYNYICFCCRFRCGFSGEFEQMQLCCVCITWYQRQHRPVSFFPLLTTSALKLFAWASLKSSSFRSDKNPAVGTDRQTGERECREKEERQKCFPRGHTESARGTGITEGLFIVDNIHKYTYHGAID